MCAQKNLLLIVRMNDALMHIAKKWLIGMLVKFLSEGIDNVELADEDSDDKHIVIEISKNGDGAHKLNQSYLAKRNFNEHFFLQ